MPILKKLFNLFFDNDSKKPTKKTTPPPASATKPHAQQSHSSQGSHQKKQSSSHERHPSERNDSQRHSSGERHSSGHRKPSGPHSHERRSHAPAAHAQTPIIPITPVAESVIVQIEEPVAPTPKVSFTELGLNPKVVEILTKNGFEFATEVQEKSVPIALKGENIFCSSETGSGKTLSFCLPMIHKLYEKQIHQALIICPTREIAIQTQKILQLFENEHVSSALVIGGTNMHEQKQTLLKHPNVLVATPGRLLDMLSTGLIWLQYTGYVVLDEADRMLDMGFEEDLLKINDELTGEHQTLLFSATLFPEIKKVANRYAPIATEITVGKPHQIAGTIEHRLVEVKEEDKYHAMRRLIVENDDKKVVFFNTIRETDAIARRLRRDRVLKTDCLHSKHDQSTRERLIQAFRDGHLTTLLATDVAARGIDVPNIELVINYDLPNNAEEYIHRVGRTGRKGNSGKAISFYSDKDMKKLKAIETLLKEKLPGSVNAASHKPSSQSASRPHTGGGYKRPNQNRSFHKKPSSTPRS